MILKMKVLQTGYDISISVSPLSPSFKFTTLSYFEQFTNTHTNPQIPSPKRTPLLFYIIIFLPNLGLTL